MVCTTPLWWLGTDVLLSLFPVPALQGPLLCSTEISEFAVVQHLYSCSILPCPQNQQYNLQPNVWDTGDVHWVNLRPKTFKILSTHSCLLWVDLTGNLSLEEEFMQPVLQGIFLPFLHTRRYQRSQSPSRPLSLGPPARHWEVLWDFRPEASDFFQSTKDTKSSEVSRAIASDATFCLSILKCLQRLRPLTRIALNYVISIMPKFIKVRVAWQILLF